MKNKIATTILCAALSAASLSAADIFWTGTAGDWDYSNAANWSPTLPASNDWQDVVVFGAGATSGTVLIGSVSGGAAPSHNGIRFETAGWTLSNQNRNFNELSRIHSAGAGVNVIQSGWSQKYAATWTIEAENTLIIEGNVYQNSNSITVNGGGTLQFNNSLTGNTEPGWGLNLNDITVVINTASPFAFNTGGVIYLNDIQSKLQLQTTVVAAEGLIGGRVLDGLGYGLVVTDLGNGYVQIASAIPEPGTYALFAAFLALAFVTLRKRRNQ